MEPLHAKLADLHVLNSKFLELNFEMTTPHRLSFRAGQYILLSVPGTARRKSYSLASTPSIDHGFRLLIDLAPQGLGTKYLESLRVGDEITFLGPIGGFVFPEPGSPVEAAEQSLVFIATGSGIAPIRGMLDFLLIDKQDTRPAVLYWGLRFAENQFWFDYFTELSEQHPNFVFHPTLSRPPEEGWTLCRGRVTDCLLVHQQPKRAGYYLCGADEMVKEVAAMLAERGITKEHIHRESFV